MQLASLSSIRGGGERVETICRTGTGTGEETGGTGGREGGPLCPRGGGGVGLRALLP